jgi:hypothetical protein
MTPIAILAKRMVLGARRTCNECDADMGRTHERFCSEDCRAGYQVRTAY